MLAFDASGRNLQGDYRSQQSGWYLQSVYQFLPRWRIGARYDALQSNSPYIALSARGVIAVANLAQLLPAAPTRSTLMVDWNPSEFSRVRAQYAWDDSRAALRDRQFFLQYIYSIGAHGAHKF